MNLVKQVRKSLDRNSFLFITLRAIYAFFRAVYQGGLSFFFRLFPIERNKIVINNHHGQGYGDNAKYIVEELLKLSNSYEIVWLLKNKTKEEADLPEQIRVVKFGSIRNIYEMTTAKLWIENNRVSQYLFKRKGQFYIQTWHGGLGLKKIEGDAPYGTAKINISHAKRDSSITDLYISNSKHLSDIYRRAFWYSGEILEVGYPKNDIFYSENDKFREKLRDFYKIPPQSKIILYAPTFRDSNSLDSYNIDFNALKNALRNKNEDLNIMVRLHPRIHVSNFHDIFGSDIINASGFPDMQELILGIDSLVTDYSSCMFDAALAGIPTFIYASDISSYMDERGFYFKLEELPFTVSENTESLINNIFNYDFESSCRKINDFYKKVGLYDQGHASKAVVEKIHSFLLAN